jgi:hypothetical protein
MERRDQHVMLHLLTSVFIIAASENSNDRLNHQRSRIIASPTGYHAPNTLAGSDNPTREAFAKSKDDAGSTSAHRTRPRIQGLGDPPNDVRRLSRDR